MNAALEFASVHLWSWPVCPSLWACRTCLGQCGRWAGIDFLAEAMLGLVHAGALAACDPGCSMVTTLVTVNTHSFSVW